MAVPSFRQVRALDEAVGVCRPELEKGQPLAAATSVSSLGQHLVDLAPAVVSCFPLVLQEAEILGALLSARMLPQTDVAAQYASLLVAAPQVLVARLGSILAVPYCRPVVLLILALPRVRLQAAAASLCGRQIVA